MKIGWIIPTVGIFGSVREMIEISNALVRRGHQVTIYHPDGKPCTWLTSLGSFAALGEIPVADLDVMIGIVDWKTELYKELVNVKAKVKAICLLGFEPTAALASSLRGEVKSEDQADRIIRDSMSKGYMVLADSSWQVEWFKNKVGYPAGPAFGGINLKMFYPGKQRVNNPQRVIYSNDPRPRKGTDTVLTAIEILKGSGLDLEFDSYWNRRFTQQELADFYRGGDVFLDGHRRAGWCNPVAEAMACGCVPVCTDIGANRDFSRHEETALIVPVDNPEAMAAEALRLLENREFRNILKNQGWQRIQTFSYDNVAVGFESELKAKVSG